MTERAASAVLAGESNGDAVQQQGSEGHGFRAAPVEVELAAHHALPASQLTQEIRVRDMPVGNAIRHVDDGPQRLRVNSSVGRRLDAPVGRIVVGDV